VTAVIALANRMVLASAVLTDPGSGVGRWVAANWLMLLIMVAVGIVLAIALTILAKWSRIAMNIFLDNTITVTTNLQDYEPSTGEIVSFMSRDGRTLRGMFVDRPPGLPDRGTVIFCHEFSSDMFSAGRYAWPLASAGYTVFTFDFRGHGRSSSPRGYEVRHWPSQHEVNDLLAAVAFVKTRRDIRKTGLGILGVSRGASAACIAAVLNSDIQCLVLDSVFSTDYLVDHMIRRWATIFSHIDLSETTEPIFSCRLVRAIMMLYVELKLRCRFPSARKALVRLDQVPALFIAGERDTYVRPEYQRTLFNTKAGEKEMWVCPNAKHNQAVATDPKTYAEKILTFFGKHLSAGSEAAEQSESASGRKQRQMAG